MKGSGEINLAWKGKKKVLKQEAHDDDHLPPPTSLCPEQNHTSKVGIPSILIPGFNNHSICSTNLFLFVKNLILEKGQPGNSTVYHLHLKSHLVSTETTILHLWQLPGSLHPVQEHFSAAEHGYGIFLWWLVCGYLLHCVCKRLAWSETGQGQGFEFQWRYHCIWRYKMDLLTYINQ